MPIVSVSVFLVALSTLLIELVLTRAFDVLVTPRMAYMIITCALFAFGIAGVYRTFRPVADNQDARPLLSRYAFLFGLSTLLILPALNTIPFDYDRIYDQPGRQLTAFLAMYLALVIPFFFSGLIFTTVFSAYAKRIQRLYFWDLMGAGCGAVVIIPFLPLIAPAGLLFAAGAAGMLVSGLFARGRKLSGLLLAAAVLAIAAPILRSPNYFEFRDHMNKRDVIEDKAEGQREQVVWDPISKIEVIDVPAHRDFPGRKIIAYDGGNQSSNFFPFDGDFSGLRRKLESKQEPVENHFWFSGVLLAHYLKRNQDHDALIIGSAGGQETKAALMYGASHVDAIELVGAVIKLGRTLYSNYTGGLFLDPRVSERKAEGRSFLRANRHRYDIIQMFSNHNSSSIASGTGAMDTVYLQTAEAYEEYFSHLKSDGILQINRHIYPREITTAALAWKRMGRTHFRDHVVVLYRPDSVFDTLPTLLIKMTPWTKEEVATIRAFSSHFQDVRMSIIEDPIHPERSFLSDEFYSGDLSPELQKTVPYRIYPATDDRPFFNLIRKRLDHVSPGSNTYVTNAVSVLLNRPLHKGLPMEWAHLFITALASVFFAGLFLLAPLTLSKVGRQRWSAKAPTLTYFSCLGAGFIIVELAFIEIFMKLIGFPLYTYSTVLFVMLLSAGLGSLSSQRLEIGPERRWAWPFTGILLYGALLLTFYPGLFELFLAWPIPARILMAGVLIFPLGFLMGMPFPMGILFLTNRPRGAVAWAWAVNGVFTVVGGISSVLIAIFLGYRVTIGVALATYFVAFMAMAQMRRAESYERIERPATLESPPAYG